MPQQVIHPQLSADCHRLGRLASGTLLLHRNALLHWFILVPETEAPDLLDLPPEHLASVLADCAAVSGYLKGALAYSKVNFAALGNQVPQMHLHLVGRRPGDACWPNPVWGNLAPGDPYSPAALAELHEGLQVAVELAAEDEPEDAEPS